LLLFNRSTEYWLIDRRIQQRIRVIVIGFCADKLFVTKIGLIIVVLDSSS